MKRALTRTGIIIMLLVAFLTIVSCKEKDTNNYTNMVTNFFSNQDGKYTAAVSNETDNLDLTSCLYFSENASWEISKMDDFSEVIEKTVPLVCGDNTFYVRVTDKNSNEKIYTLCVHRNNLYKVIFNSDGGTECKEQIVEEGAFASSPDSIKPGYTLSWDFDFETPISSDTTVNAVWTPKKYNITVNAPGTNSDKTVIEVEFGKEYSMPVLQKDGYEFSEWQVSGKTFEEKGIWKTTSDVSATAVFTKINYSINYILNFDDAENSPDNPSVYTVEDSVSLSIPSHPERAIFMGWYLEDGTQVTEISNGTTGEITLYAKWRVQYKVTLDAPGTDLDKTEQTVFIGEDYTLPTPSKNEYDFLCWKYDSANVSISGKWSINSDITLTAVFEAKTHGIMYVLGGGVNAAGNPSSYTVESNKIVLLDPTREGFVFDGWYKTADYETKVIEIDTGAGEEIVLYAKWLIQYTVTLDADGTDLDNTELKFILGEEYTLPVPIKNEYEFCGWQYNGTNINLSGKWSIDFDITLTAVFEAKTHEIMYVLYGGTNAEDNPSSYTVESNKIILLDPTREGFVFDGWYKTADYETKVTEIDTGSGEEIVLYAKWLAKYSVTLDSAGGTAYDTPLEIIYGSDYSLPVPEKKGYVFAGWKYNSMTVAQSGKWAIGAGEADITLVASWTPKLYTITYFLYDGINAEGNPNSYTVESNDIVLLDPSREGFVFDGWYDTADYETKVTEIDTGAEKEIVVYAKWLAKYSVTLDSAGGTADILSLETFYGGDYSLPVPMRNGYIFAGWKYNSMTVAQSGKWAIEAGETNITLVASWTPKVYTITYVLYGGINNSSNPVSYTPDDATMTLADPSNGVYIFKGWYLSNHFEESERISEIASGSAENLVLYAKWESEDESFVYYDANGGAMSQDHQTVTKGTEYSLIIPERVGYTFNGWYNGDTRIDDNGTWNVSGNVTLTASWTIIDYDISYDLGGGTSSNPSTYNVETDTFTLATPVRDGYAFVGWTGTDVVGTVQTVTIYQGTTKDREYTAVWFKKNGSNGLIYDYKDGNAVVTGYNGSFSGSGFAIPSVYEGYNVVSIEDGAFMGLGSKLSSSQPFYIDIPYSINHIGKDAFKDCSGFAPTLTYVSGDREEERKVRIENWISNLIIESGNSQVLDVIRNKCPMIGNGNYV